MEMEMNKMGKDIGGKKQNWLFLLLLPLPLVVVPLLALLFHAMGGGRPQVVARELAGISTVLPEASFSADTPKSKAEYYERAERSARDSLDGMAATLGRLGFPGAEVGGNGPVVGAQEQSRLLEARMSALQRELSRPEPAPVRRTGAGNVGATGSTASGSGELDRLEGMMRSMSSGKAADPEMAQLDAVMQGILDIQHPERVWERQRSVGAGVVDSVFRAVPAVVFGRQKLVDGARVRLRLSDTLRVSGMLVPRGHELFGSCRVSNQRLLVEVRHIRLGTSIIPVDLSVYGLDGMPGVVARDAELSQALAGGSEQAMRGLGIGGMDASLAVQVAGAGVDAARGLLSRKVRRVKVKLADGLQVLLRDNQRK